MKRTSIKEGFGGEVAFTKFIAENLETSRRLLNALDLSYEDGYTITPEEHTTHSKRVDLVVRDTTKDIVLVIESQDASGWLDSVHASKVTYYMYDKKCDDGVLICEDADEHIKGFVKWLNDNTPLRITLVSVLIFKTADNPHCEFIPLIRPTDLRDKKVRRVTTVEGGVDTSKSDIVQAIYDSNPELFTNVARNYVSRTNVGNTGVTVAIHPYTSGGFFVEAWHGGKYNNDAFRNSFTKFCKENNLEAKFQKARGYVNGPAVETTKAAVNAFQMFVNAIEAKEIQV